MMNTHILDFALTASNSACQNQKQAEKKAILMKNLVTKISLSPHLLHFVV